MKITVMGLGYVGGTLFELLIKKRLNDNVIGFDISKEKINLLKKKFPSHIITNNTNDINDSDIYIICVPTPINQNNDPIYDYLYNAINIIGSKLKKDNIVIIESTIEPLRTQKLYLELMNLSGLNKNDFSIIYSPERFAPDTNIKMNEIEKLIGVNLNDERAIKIGLDLYKSIIDVNVHLCTIEEAEMSKMMENIQRELLIALANELQIYADKMHINFQNVLDLASTKYNFVSGIKPGFVGGHCLSVDPYFLIESAKINNLDLNLIKNMRKVNENYIDYHISNILNISKKLNTNPVIILKRVAYKPNSTDLRNSKQIQFMKKLINKNIDIYVYDTLSLINNDYFNKIKLEFKQENINIDLILKNETEYYSKTSLCNKIKYHIDKIGDYEIWI